MACALALSGLLQSVPPVPHAGLSPRGSRGAPPWPGRELEGQQGTWAGCWAPSTDKWGGLPRRPTSWGPCPLMCDMQTSPRASGPWLRPSEAHRDAARGPDQEQAPESRQLRSAQTPRESRPPGCVPSLDIRGLQSS